MEAVQDIATESLVDDPVEKLAGKILLGPPKIKEYLKCLESRGYIKLIYGPRRSIVCLQVLQNDLSGLEDEAPQNYTPVLVSAPAAPAPPKETPKPITPPAPQPKPEKPIAVTPEPVKPKLPRVAVLLDYDNIEIGAWQAKIRISWAKLKESARRYGRIVVADAYLSPSSTTQKVIGALANAGWRPVYCPMRYKDKDNVDYTMTADARKYLTEDFADIVIIASRDADFRGLNDFAMDHHKTVIFLGIGDAREINLAPISPVAITQQAVAVYNPAPLGDDPDTHKFAMALECVETGKTSGPYNGPKHVGFIRSIITASSRVAALGINTLEDFTNKVWEGVKNNWGNVFTLNQTKSVLHIFVQKGLLCKEGEFFKVSEDHVAAKLVLDPTVA